jgi:hypothetical protein
MTTRKVRVADAASTLVKIYAHLGFSWLSVTEYTLIKRFDPGGNTSLAPGDILMPFAIWLWLSIGDVQSRLS